MGNPLQIPVIGPHQRSLAGGRVITFDRSSMHHGVWMREWDAQGNPLQRRDLTYEEYEEYRKAHPELDMPELRPPEPSTNANGNTVGKVVGEEPPANVPASEANPPVQAETPGEAGVGNEVLDGLQTGLDVIGLIPGFGEIADLANAGISAARGDFVGAGLSLASAIPFAGWLAAGAKAARRAADIAGAGAKGGKEVAEEAGGQAGKQSDEAAQAANPPGGKVRDEKKKKPCIVGNHRTLKNVCKKHGMVSHHIVPDQFVRTGRRKDKQIPRILSEDDGAAICIEGNAFISGTLHQQVHADLDALLKRKMATSGVTDGTLPLDEVLAASLRTIIAYSPQCTKEILTQVGISFHGVDVSQRVKIR